MSGTLFIVGTPIGNLSDFSKRAEETLRQADFIAAEDTRVTLKLLNHFEIKKPMISYYEHNKNQRESEIINRLLSGQSCALVSDAGMPCISDPGEPLVKSCYENGIKIAAVPGPCALVTALAISGLPTGRFSFEGFLSMNKNNRKQHLEEIKNDTRTLIFYEAPHKLPATLRDLLSILGNRRISIVREITKIYEEVIRTDLISAVAANASYKGEIVLIIEGKAPSEPKEWTLEEAAEIALLKVSEGVSKSAAAKAAAEQTGIKKGDIYKIIAEK